MCLVTPTKTPYVAPEDIFCYKVLAEIGDQLVTPFRKFPIVLGKIYTTGDICENDSHELSEGFLHAYASPSYMYKRKSGFIGFGKAKVAMYLAVIPKGTKFFVNNDCSEICATALRVIKKVADIEERPLFDTMIANSEEVEKDNPRVNQTFDNYKNLLTTMENIVGYAKNNNLYPDIVSEYETFEEGSYEKNLYAYRLVVAVLTENEKNSLTKGRCYYPCVDFYDGRGWRPDSGLVKVGTIISEGTSYVVVGGGAGNGAGAGLGSFASGLGVSTSWTHVGFRSVSSLEIAKFISQHFGRLVFDIMYGCSNCDYRWVDEND